MHICITSVSENVYIVYKFDDIANKYNNTYHRIIKIKLVDVNRCTYYDFNKANDEKDPKFKISDIVRILKYKNLFEKSYVPNWSEEVFVIKKVITTVP